MTKRQTYFSFSLQPSFHANDFIRAPCNDIAYDALVRGPLNDTVTILWGPRGSGKTHLASLWQNRLKAQKITLDQVPDIIAKNLQADYIIDEIEHLSEQQEEVLFHFINHLRSHNKHLLLTSKKPVAQWELTLPDLTSRLMSAPLWVVSLPDESTIMMVLAKLFSDRHIHPQARVLSFMVKRIERSFRNLVPLVAWIDQETLRHRRQITIPLIKHLLEGYHANQYLTEKSS